MFQIIPILLFIASHSIDRSVCDGINDFSSSNVTDTLKTNETATSTTTTTTTNSNPLDSTESTFPPLEDLVLAEQFHSKKLDGSSDVDIFDDKNTAKRTISSRFTGPIIVSEDVNLFTPADDLAGKQINVQILEEPETATHNNGQFLKQTVYTKTENNTFVESKTTTTTTTTERPLNRRKHIVANQRVVSSRYVAPLAGSSISRCPTLDGCGSTTAATAVVTEKTARKIENININQNTQVIFEEPKFIPFGTRFASTKSPCQLASAPSPCSSSPRIPVYTSTPTTVRVRPINSTPLIPPRVYTTPTPVVSTATVASVPIHSTTTTTIVPEPIFIHRVTEVPTVKIIEKPVPVEKVVKEIVNVPGPTVEKIIPVEVERVVVKEVKVPVNTIVEKHINHPPQFVEKLVPYPVHNVIHAKPIEIEKVVHKEVPVAVPVDRIVEKHVPVQARYIFGKLFSFSWCYLFIIWLI